ncbi:MAG: tetratricopeptide repeat protein [Candidatus Solibacter sp.]
MRGTVIAVAIAVGAVGPIVAVESPQVARARDCYQHGDFPAAIKLLDTAGGLDAEGLLLAGQAHYHGGNIREACGLLERAVAIKPKVSRYIHWLGRAYGRRAEGANVLLAPRYAVRARQSFEEAVRLDPRNVEAWNDLFAYYLEAPGFLGGGLDKAGAVAERTLALDPAEYHFERARLAEKHKQPKQAETHYRQAVVLAPLDPGRLIDLAKFLESQGRVIEADRVFAQAHEIAPAAPAVIYELARTYVQSGRRLEDARSLLQQYLRLNVGPDDPPRSDVLNLLKRLPNPPIVKSSK